MLLCLAVCLHPILSSIVQFLPFVFDIFSASVLLLLSPSPVLVPEFACLFFGCFFFPGGGGGGVGCSFFVFF